MTEIASIGLFEGQTLQLHRRGATLELSLQHAPLNEIGTTTLDELETAVRMVSEDSEGARALIVHSLIPGGFCAGADLRELQGGLQSRREEGASDEDIRHEVREFIERIHAVFNRLDTLPMTTVAAVHGVCFGGGFELALTCDIIVADKSARFCFPELRLGIVPGFGGIPRLRRDVGNAVVRDLLLTGRSVSARRAHEVGLVSQLVGRGQDLQVARAVANQAARFDPHTTRAAKAFLKPLPEAELRREKELFCQQVTSPVTAAALQRFVESDDPRPYLP